MKSTFIGFAFVLLFINNTNAQNTDTAQIKQVIERTFKAMNLGDTAQLMSCFYPGATLQVNTSKNDSSFARIVTVTNFVSNIGKQKVGSLDERVTSWGPILINNDIATAWVPYSFYLNGDFSHKGIDAFNMIRINKEWKILSLMYNMLK